MQQRTKALVVLSSLLVACTSSAEEPRAEATSGGDELEHSVAEAEEESAELEADAEPEVVAEPAAEPLAEVETELDEPGPSSDGEEASADPAELPLREPRSVVPRTSSSSSSLAADVVRRVIRRITAPIRQCYERELRIDPSYQGRVGVRAVTRPDGSLGLEVEQPSGNRRLDRCVRQAVRQVRFPRDDRPAPVQYPFLFDAGGIARVVILTE